MMVKFVINYLGHDTDACSQVAERVREMLSPDRTSDGGAARVFLFTRRGLSMAALHSSVNYTTSVVGNVRLFPRISLIYLAYVGTCIASRSSIFKYSFLFTSMNSPNCSSATGFLIRSENGKAVVS